MAISRQISAPIAMWLYFLHFYSLVARVVSKLIYFHFHLKAFLQHRTNEFLFDGGYSLQSHGQFKDREEQIWAIR